MNIFEGAKFGDRFKTRNGRMAIYGFPEDERHVLIVENFGAVFRYKDNGVSNYPNDKIDIIGKWQEPIDEEELDRLAYNRFQYYDIKKTFSKLIDKVSGKGTWDSNPYVFVYDFELVK